MPIPIQHNSRRRHLQRFLKLDVLSVVLLWFPIIKAIINRQLKIGSQLIIALDGTKWKAHNVLMVSIIIQNRGWPIFWCLLEKEGSSNLQQQQKVLRPVIRLLKDYKLVIVGDREFHSIELASWLHHLKVSFVLRQKFNTTCRQKRAKFQPLKSLPILPGIHHFYTDIHLTQKNGFGRFNLALYQKRKYHQKSVPEPWYLLTNLRDCQSAVKIYAQRFGIEAMFKDCKTGGYNLESSQANPDRLVRLILLIALAMTSAWLQGQKIKLQGQQRYVSRLSENGRNRRRHSNFTIGLSSETWTIAFDACQLWVQELMDLNRNKKSFYQQGLRAITLIQQRI